MKRRNFLTLVGGGVVLAAGGFTGSVATRTPDNALAPWDLAGGPLYADPRMAALSYAVLAPSPHNRQPWTIALAGDNRVVIGIDDKPLLPHTDPMSRQISIGLGCFLELMRMAAAENGIRVDLDLFPTGQDVSRLDPSKPIAVATFTPDSTVEKDPLFAHVFERRSTKEPYDLEKPVDTATLEKLVGASREGFDVGGTVDQELVRTYRTIAEQALLIELQTDRTYEESVDLFRIGAQEVNANPDGIAFTGPMFEVMRAIGLFSREAAMDRASMVYKGGIDAVLENARTAMGFIWLSTPDNTRISQIATGADWLRINLVCAREDVAMQPMSQALQEYPEMAELYGDVHRELAPDGGTVQMLLRIGYCDQVARAPRWPIEAKLVG